MALPLVGCLSNEIIPAAIDPPNAYRAASGKPDAALPSVVWWRGFRSKELTDLVEESLTSNFDVAAAVARIVQADATSRIAGAALLPALDFNGSAQRAGSSQTTGNSGNFGRGAQSTYGISLSASYEIDFWGKNRATLRAAEELAVASRFDREVVSLTTVTTVANTYFLVLQAKDRLDIARKNIEAADRVYKLILQRFDVGTASALDVAQQKSLVDQQRATVPPLEQSLRQNIATLAVLIGRPPESVRIRVTSMSVLAIPPVTPGLPSDLIGQRPDIREAEANLASANANVHNARAQFFPSITLTAEGGYQTAVLKNLVRPESTFFNLAGGLLQPVLEGGRIQGNFDLQKGKQDELLQVYRKSIVNGFADVERALVGVQQAKRLVELDQAVVESSRKAFELAETRLREGTVDLVTVLQTQTTLFQAQDALVVAQFNRLTAVVTLFQALGGGWQKPKPDTSKVGEAPPRIEEVTFPGVQPPRPVGQGRH
ncbi:efflux transporter outer membrane subunit [Rhodoplanes sp. Z2-YC6860]|uniref:efflux transporter outer membrane subunit n=1 Tax=Rhodoplanes sp. Z2-YC6860 TaxID=674703 RepID=UPI001F000BAE|nr:efflux transporter outer membrane subunit [Rhodoplanes sp. Z2-YC6860]